MSAVAPTAATPRWSRRVTAAASSRSGWAVLIAIVVVALVVGSIRPAAPSTTARIAALENVIKCPSCDDLSIAQSDAGVAQALRREVTQLVDAGWSTPRIEAWVESQYGTDEILTPPGGVAWAIPLIAGAIGVVVVATLLVAARRRRGRRATPADERIVRQALAELEGSGR